MSMPIMVRSTLLACALAVPPLGCTTVPRGTQADKILDGHAFAMHPGDRVLLSDRSRLHYVGVQSDSRCPPDVQCIQAGNAVVDFSWQPAGGAAQSFQLGTPERPQSRSLGSRRVALLALAFGPAPQVRLQVDSAP